MRTVVIPPPGIFGLGRYRTVNVIARELTDHELIGIAMGLAAQDIWVSPTVDVFHTLHLWALEPYSTEQEVKALRAFAEHTDCRIDWHGKVAAKHCPIHAEALASCSLCRQAGDAR